MPDPEAAIDVAAAIIVHEGRVLVARRAAGQSMAGLWEFPGGKIEPGETPQTCIVRELAEELAIDCAAGAVIAQHLHAYPGGCISLIAVEVTILSGEPRPTVHDAVLWLAPAEILELADLAPADVPIAMAVAEWCKTERGQVPFLRSP